MAWHSKLGLRSTWMVIGAVGSMLGVAACGTPADDGEATMTAAETGTDAVTESSGPDTQTESDTQDTDVTPAPCADGFACATDEFCTQGTQSCDCDSDFDYCELTATYPGCLPIPQPCSILTGADQQACIADSGCTIGGYFQDGVLICETYDECAGDCDFSPESCVDTSSSTTVDESSTSSDDSSGSSDGGSSGTSG